MKVKHILAGLLAAALLTGCGSSLELTKFKTDMDDFCTCISELDTSIDSIDTSSGYYREELLKYLDELDLEFQEFAKLDFPEEFDYLENLADEASEYMTEAVKSYHQIYDSGSYSESIADYALQNYSRSYKRIQIIITFLHGEEPKDTDLTIEYSK